jgi:hypothetical protein
MPNLWRHVASHDNRSSFQGERSDDRDPQALPVAQCEGCGEYLIADAVFAKVEELLSKVDSSVELEIIPFAA